MNDKLLSLAVLAGVSVGGFAEARDQINIVGSSTVYPFTTAVAETFGKTTKFRTPVVESTGSGGGLKLFCAGVGVGHPDMTNASRRIKKSEVETCAKNGVTDIIEVKVGYDGIVLANAKSAPRMTISRKHLFLALAKDIPQGEGKLVPNPFKMWNEIDPSLPATKIEVLGPPPTSGTRDAFVELATEGGCRKFGWIKAMKKKDKKKYKAICHGIREDGAFVEAGENDNLIVQKLVENSKAYGVFGFSFLDQNANLIQGSVMDGVAPTFENIADTSYPVSRPLYVYVKKAHIGKIPGMEEFLAEYTSEKAWGLDGYLTDKGLIPMPDAERGKFREAATKMIPYGS